MINYHQPTCQKCKAKVRLSHGNQCGCGYLRVQQDGNWWLVHQGFGVELMPVEKVTMRTNLK